MKISFVLAMSKNRVIGVKNRLPWRIPSDMSRFTKLTTGHPVIMGSKTFESFPQNYSPLPNRTNIVMTRDAGKQYPGAKTVSSLAEAIKAASESPGAEEIFIIGGGQVFSESIQLADTIYLTEVDTEIEGDAFFPELDPIRWEEYEEGRFEADAKNEYGGRFLTYTRTNKYPIVEPNNGRNDEYRADLTSILESGNCPFCPGGKTLKQQEILKKDDSWFLTKNYHPLAGTIHHFIVTPVRHVTFVEDILPEEWAKLSDLRRWLRTEYSMTGDAMYVRSGEPIVTGATVSHLHFHIIVPAEFIQVSFGKFKA